MKQTPENRVKKVVKDYLKWHGWFVFHILQGLGSYPGIADLIAIKDGRVLFIECKAPNGKLSEKQDSFRSEIWQHGGEYVVVHDLNELTLYLEGKEWPG